MSARPTIAKSFSVRMLLALANRATRFSSGNSAEQGLSLIECLIAIIVIAITVTTVTPPIFLATASRIQSRRAEQANQVAQAEVDRIRTIVERGSYTTTVLPVSTGQKDKIQEFAAASGVENGLMVSSNPAACSTEGKTLYPQTLPGSANTLIPVDINGDCKAEFAMQVFRTEGCVPSGEDASKPYSFYVGVRVYSYDPEKPLPTTISAERANLAMTTGRRDQGADLIRPLQTLYTKVARNVNEKSYQCVAN